jgi:hypothetical protein
MARQEQQPIVFPTSAYGTEPQHQHSSINCSPSEFLLSQSDPAEAVHSVYKLKTQPELVRYLHASAGFPTKPTWLTAIKNKQFSSWPGLTTDADRCHFPELDKTHKRHGQRTPSILQSTKQTQAAAQPEEQDSNKNIIATKQKPSSKSTTLRMKPYAKYRPTRLAVSPSNQVGAISTSWHSLKVTLVEPMKNRSAGEMVQAYQALIDCLNATGIFPLEHILDNKCSALFKQQIQLNKMTYQLVPPHNHRHKQAEKAIKTFKDHFISILCSTDSSFPLHLWDWLLSQAKHTLNMLCPAQS